MQKLATQEPFDDKPIVKPGSRVTKICLIIVALVCILLFVICIVLAVLYSRAISKTPSPPTVDGKPKEYKICTEDRCFEYGKEIIKSLNQSVNPCEDFYAYACGGWQKRHPVKEGQKSSSIFGSLQEKNFDILKEVLNHPARYNYSKNDAVMKTSRFYKSCMNTTAIEKAGFLPLMKLIYQYGGWSIFNNFDNRVSYDTRIARVARELNVDSLIHVWATTDKYNTSKRILQMGYAPITFPTSMYLNKSEKVQNEVKKKIGLFNKLVGINGTEAKLMEIYNFETKLAQIKKGKSTAEEDLMESVRKSIRERREITDHRMKMKDFCVKSGFSCNLLKTILNSTYGRNFTGEEMLLVTNITYFKNLYKLIQTTISSGNEQVISNYVMWRVFYKYITAASLNASSLLQERPPETPPPRSRVCLTSEMYFFYMSLGLIYVNANYDGKSGETLQEMTDEITQSFIERLKQQTWMDPETKRKAKEKALAAKVFICNAEKIKDAKKLEDRYKSLKVTDKYFSNIVAKNHFIKMREINGYGKPVDKNESMFHPCTAMVNALYSPWDNAIIYLAGIIQPPFFKLEYPRYLQYGGIGTVVGHELSHGFDDYGRQYDKDGNLHNWWSHSADAKYKQKAKCIVNQYGKYTLHGMKINGNLTKNENIADNGAIKLTFHAYRQGAAKREAEKILPGLKLSPEQLFFVAYAQTYCSVFTKEGAKKRLDGPDPHSPGRYRVIGVLSNFEKFSEAFSCPADSPMNPKKKCSVW